MGVNPFDIGDAIARSRARRASCPDTLALADRPGTTRSPSLCCAYRANATAARRAALRRPPRHLGDLLRRGVHPRHPFRRAAEEGLLDFEHSTHVGIRGPLYSRKDLEETNGSASPPCPRGTRASSARPRSVEQDPRAPRRPAGVRLRRHRRARPSVRPRHRHPRAGRARQPRTARILRGLGGVDVVGADVVEVSPAYDHAEITGMAAAHVVYELLSTLPGHAPDLRSAAERRRAVSRRRGPSRPSVPGG